MKRITLSFLFLLSFLTAFAYDVVIDGIYYNIDKENKTAKVTSGTNKYRGSVTIPSFLTYNGMTLPVTSIENDAFSLCRSLTSVTIPNSVTRVGGSAFYYCSSLVSVTIPNSVTGISDHTFYNCSSLTSVIIPNSVTSIGNNAFSNCSSLTSVTIPDSVTSIEEHAFSHCSSLTSVTIGNSVTSIGVNAFDGCSSLTSITIPNSVTSIEVGVFTGCSSLTSVTIPNSVTSIGGRAFSGCKFLTSVTIPDSVTSIGKSVFYNCSSLTSVTIPNSVTGIGDDTFSNCSSLTSVTIGNSVRSIGEYAFSHCSSLTSVTIPNTVWYIGEKAFGYCSSLTSVTIGNSVTSIRDGAFRNCSSLKEIYSLNPTPPGLSGSPFEGVNNVESNVYVPKESVGAYKGAKGWKDFWNISQIIVPIETIEITGDRIVNSTLSMIEGESVVLWFTFTPSNTTDRVFAWSSDNPSVAMVSIEGVVTAIGIGEATITVSSSNGKFASCKVVVTENIDKIANNFRTTFAEILNKTTADVTSSDLDAINDALEAYENLSDAAKEKLTKEKNLLDSLKQKAEELKAAEKAEQDAIDEANDFRTTYAEILGKTIADVTSSDLEVINKALDDYEKLSDLAKSKLTIEKNLLDRLKLKAEELVNCISTISIGASDNIYYNISGQRVNRNTKGFTIKNGKKHLRK